MLSTAYTILSAENHMLFEFDSIGIKGTIRKMVQYTRIGDSDYYNLGFGDKNIISNEIDDSTVSNNGDSQRVLLTVAQTIFNFTEIYPEALIVATGSTESRTRLYRIGITNNLTVIEQYFHVFGLLNDEWQPFRKDTHYTVFLITRKNDNFNL